MFIVTEDEAEAIASTGAYGYAALMQTVHGLPGVDSDGMPKPIVKQPKYTRKVTVTRPDVIPHEQWRHVRGLYRAFRLAGMERERAARELAVMVEVWAWAVELNQPKVRRQP